MNLIYFFTPPHKNGFYLHYRVSFLKWTVCLRRCNLCENIRLFSRFQNLQSQMTEFEVSAEPLQDWLNNTEVRVQESSARLHDLPAKKQELSKLQVLWSPRLCSLADSIVICSKTSWWLNPHIVPLQCFYYSLKRCGWPCVSIQFVVIP